MKIHEYQAKQLLRTYGVAVPEGRAVVSPDEAAEAARQLHTDPVVVKAQIHAGGRGKAGGVQAVSGAQAAYAAAQAMLGSVLVTAQTGTAGKMVRKLLVEAGCEIAGETYLSFTVDPKSAKIVMIASAEGGTEIERLAETAPGKIIQSVIQPQLGLKAYQSRRVAERIGLRDALVAPFVTMADALYRAFTNLDCSLVEVNPLAETKDGRLLALDAKIALDDNALMRHPELAALRDPDEEDPRETEASAAGLSYIPLDGSIGCLVNGAGLAMATMDMIKLYGGEPANFLDIGGSASTEKVTSAFRIILSDPNVKGILVNIFGGIMHCDVIAEGVIAATRSMGLRVPLVVRLNGTAQEAGNRLLAESGLLITAAQSMEDAVEKITALVKE